MQKTRGHPDAVTRRSFRFNDKKKYFTFRDVPRDDNSRVGRRGFFIIILKKNIVYRSKYEFFILA